jgi:hypothetical protein
MMDVTTILDESLKTFSRPAASKAAQFILMLSVIDRAVLPRRIVFTNGRARLGLIAVDRRAQLDGDAALSPTELTTLLASFCRETHALSHEVRACDAPRAAGFTISEIINTQTDVKAQDGPLSKIPGAEAYRFDDHGWPLRISPSAGAKALVSAWLVHLWVQNWLKRHEKLLGDSLLLTTTGGVRSRELALRFSPGDADMMAFASQDLGQLLAACRAFEGTQRAATDESRGAVRQPG